MLPVRCFHCGYILGKHETRLRELNNTMSREDAIHQMELNRRIKFASCCRMVLLTTPLEFEDLELGYSELQELSRSMIALQKEEEPILGKEITNTLGKRKSPS